MAVRFKGDNLVREDGTVFEISYEALLKACLKESYETISIKEIIFSVILETTGENVIGNTHRKSSLFNRLEEQILKFPVYQKAKEQKMAKDQANRDWKWKQTEMKYQRAKVEGYLTLKKR